MDPNQSQNPGGNKKYAGNYQGQWFPYQGAPNPWFHTGGFMQPPSNAPTMYPAPQTSSWMPPVYNLGEQGDPSVADVEEVEDITPSVSDKNLLLHLHDLVDGFPLAARHDAVSDKNLLLRRCHLDAQLPPPGHQSPCGSRHHLLPSSSNTLPRWRSLGSQPWLRSNGMKKQWRRDR